MNNGTQNGTYNLQIVMKLHAVFGFWKHLQCTKRLPKGTPIPNLQRGVGGGPEPPRIAKNSWGTPRDAPFAKIIHPTYNYKTEAPTLYQISAMNRQLIGSGFEFLSPHHQVRQPFKAQKVYINWYIFMQLSEKWPRVHVGNYPILFF